MAKLDVEQLINSLHLGSSLNAGDETPTGVAAAQSMNPGGAFAPPAQGRVLAPMAPMIAKNLIPLKPMALKPEMGTNGQPMTPPAPTMVNPQSNNVDPQANNVNPQPASGLPTTPIKLGPIEYPPAVGLHAKVRF